MLELVRQNITNGDWSLGRSTSRPLEGRLALGLVLFHLGVENTHPKVVLVVIRVEIDGLAGLESVTSLVELLRPLLDVDIGTIEGRWLVTLATRLDLDDVDALDAPLTEEFIEDGLHILPSVRGVNAGDVDLRDGSLRHRICSWYNRVMGRENISIFFSVRIRVEKIDKKPKKIYTCFKISQDFRKKIYKLNR